MQNPITDAKPTDEVLIAAARISNRIGMQNIIFTVRDGPEDKPNRFFLARCIAPADASRTFLVQEVDPKTYKSIEAASVWAIHDNAMQISWHHSRAAQLIAVNESLSNLRGAAPLPRPVGEPTSTILPCGTGLQPEQRGV